MNYKEFNEILKSRMEKTVDVLDTKANEYARNEDRLSNFKRAAAMLQVIPARALVGAWSKHITSILDMVDDWQKGKQAPVPVWEEKIGDAINYLILLEALVKEGTNEDKSNIS